MSLTIELPDAEKQVMCQAEARGIPPEEYAQDLLQKALLHEQNLRKIALIDSFMDEDGDEQAETWAYLEKALAESRQNSRR